MRVVGIVGAESAKFDADTQHEARMIIRRLLGPSSVLCSGHCHLGGIDIWAEEEAKAMHRFNPDYIFAPKSLMWSTGYKPRNLKIAAASHELHNIVVASYPAVFAGMRFEGCYHCGDSRPKHVKSGGCWTAKQAQRLGKPAFWHIVGVPPQEKPQ